MSKDTIPVGALVRWKKTAVKVQRGRDFKQVPMDDGRKNVTVKQGTFGIVIGATMVDRQRTGELGRDFAGTQLLSVIFTSSGHRVCETSATLEVLCP